VLLIESVAFDESTIAASAVSRIGARAGHRHEPHGRAWYQAVPGPPAGIQPHGWRAGTPIAV